MIIYLIPLLGLILNIVHSMSGYIYCRKKQELVVLPCYSAAVVSNAQSSYC